ncbi:MAG: hypothetical protein ACYCPW_09170 [Nitrososphaerales archaeon]
MKEVIISPDVDAGSRKAFSKMDELCVYKPIRVLIEEKDTRFSVI